jgi:ATP synthase in type III secretion protein N
VRALMAKHDEVELLVRLGEYKRGSDSLADKAIDRMADIHAFLCQRPSEKTSASEMLRHLEGIAV